MIKPSKFKAHTRYMLEGKRVPGVTTILGILNKPNLIKWANDLGLAGIDSDRYRDETAEIGRLAHVMILAHFTEEELDLSDFTPNQTKAANQAMDSFYKWMEGHKFVPHPRLIEEPMVSAKYGYGGTPDLVIGEGNKMTLFDFKTGSGIYEESLYQAAAYHQLVREQGIKVKIAKIVRIGREAGENYEERTMVNFKPYWQVFLSCLEIYNLKKEIKRGGK